VPPLLGRRESPDRLHDLGDHGRGLGPRVELGLEAVEAFGLARRRRAELAAVAVRVRDRVVLRAHRFARALAILLARGDLERAERQAMVAVLEERDVTLLLVLARELQRELVGLRAAGREEGFVEALRPELDQPLGQPNDRDAAVLARDLQHV